MIQITFFVHLGKDYTVRKYLASWGVPVAARVQIRHYPGLQATGRSRLKRLEQRLRAWRVGVFVPPGHGPTAEKVDDKQVYIFTDFERLDAGEMAVVEQLWETLASDAETVQMLNHPRHAMRRFELLQTLYENQLNQFAVYEATTGLTPRRWPVFVREANDHSGSLSALCHDPESLARALADLRHRIRPGAEIMIAEFCDAADETGVVRKYGAFRVGDRILARQIHFSRHWVVREPDIVTAESTREERKYVETNPHADALLKIFDLARIDYGRIDYSLVDGRIQVWEINTNPMILIPADRDDPLRSAAHDAFGQRFTAALNDLK